MYQCSHAGVSRHTATAGNAARTEAGHETLNCQQSTCNAPIMFLHKMRPEQHEGDCLQHLCFHLQSALQNFAWYAWKHTSCPSATAFNSSSRQFSLSPCWSELHCMDHHMLCQLSALLPVQAVHCPTCHSQPPHPPVAGALSPDS